MTDGNWFWPGLGLAAVLGFWMLGAYNRVVSLRAPILGAWAQLEGELLARGQVIAALLTAVDQALASERYALAAASAAQAQLLAALEAVRPRPVRQPAVAALAQAEAAMAAAQVRLVALVEQQTALHAEPVAAAALQALRDLEPRLAFARQRFNDAALSYNAAVRQFPTRLLRRVFDFTDAGTL